MYIEWDITDGLYILRYGSSKDEAKTEIFSNEEDFRAVLGSLTEKKPANA